MEVSMYHLYRKKNIGNEEQYSYVMDISLFGCRNGYIPKIFASTLTENDNPNIGWEINISDKIKNVTNDGNAIIINLKPNNAEANLSLYEIVSVYGYSYEEWTPIMLHLRGLFTDESPIDYNIKSFTRITDDINDPIVSMTYMAGSIKDGKLIGKWTAPASSSTNSVLLWRDALIYFHSQQEKILSLSGRQ